MFKGNVTTAGINFGMSAYPPFIIECSTVAAADHPPPLPRTHYLVCFAMLTLYLSKRDQRRARKLRASTVPSEASDDYVAEDETHVDIKKAKIQTHASETDVDVSEVPVPTLTSEFRCAASIA